MTNAIHHPSRRDLLRMGGVAAAAAAVGVRPAPARAAGTPPLQVATFAGGDRLLLTAAGQAMAPGRIEFVEFGSSEVVLAAIDAGAIELGRVGDTAPAIAAACGAHVRIVAAGPGELDAPALLLPGTSTVGSVAELKGRRIGVARAGAAYFDLMRRLAEAGLAPATVEIVALAPTEAFGAFAGGQLDAWAANGRWVAAAVASGARLLGAPASSVYAAAPESLDDPARRALVSDYFRRLRRALSWRTAHLDIWAAAQAAAAGVPTGAVLALARAQVPRLVPVDDATVAAQQAVADRFAASGVIAGPVLVEPVYDRRFADVLSGAA